VALAAMLAAPVPARAQAADEVGPPRRLVPAEPIEVGPPPKAVAPRAPTGKPPPIATRTVNPPPAVKTPAATAEPGAEPGVQVETLAALDPSSVGVLNEDQGGLGLDMWLGTRRSLVERLLPRLPATTQSPAMQSLMRRLLLSTARVPEGEATAPSLLGLRVERLIAAGALEAVGALLRVVPAHLDDKALARADVASRLLAGDNSGACVRTQGAVRRDDDPYWLKALSFCKALDGEHAAASLGVALLREQGVEDEAFYTLIDALAGDAAAKLDSLIAPTALHLAMLRASRRAIPADAIEGTNPAFLGVIATSPNAELEVRLLAAERAEAGGTLSTRALGQIYASIAFAPEALASAVTTAEADRGPHGRALLYQAIEIETVPEIKAELLRAAWRLAREDGRFQAAARLERSAVLSIEPSFELAALAIDAGRALLAVGELEAAQRWFDVAPIEASPALWPLMVIANPEGAVPFSPVILGEWIEGQEGPRLALMLSLLDGLGHTPEPRQWEVLLDGPLTVSSYAPSPAISLGLEAAAAAGRVGETVLLALLALGEPGPGGADPMSLRAVLKALSLVGHEADARSLALEAALAGGF
jgi:hypothetical protein